MIIQAEIDTDIMKELKLNYTQMIIISTLIHNKKLAIKALAKSNIDSDYQDLVDKEILESGLDSSMPETICLTDKFKSYYKSYTGADYFMPFHEMYPSSVSRPDGTTQYLRLYPNKCRNLFQKAIGRKGELYPHLVECLQKEIDDRTMKDGMKYMPMMHSWLANEGWSYGEELAKESYHRTMKESYGEQLL